MARAGLTPSKASYLHRQHPARGCAVVKKSRARLAAPVLLTPTGPAIEEADEALILERNPRIGSPVSPLCLTIATIVLGVLLLRQSPPQTAILGLFLFLGGLCSAHALLQAIRGRERLRLDARGLEYFWFSGLIGRRRLIPLGEILGASSYTMRMRPGIDGVSHDEYGLEIETLGQPLRLGQSRNPCEVDDLCRAVEARLRELKPRWLKSPPVRLRQTVERSTMLLEPPSDCAIICRREWDHTEFLGRNGQRWNLRPGELTSSIHFWGPAGHEPSMWNGSTGSSFGGAKRRSAHLLADLDSMCHDRALSWR